MSNTIDLFANLCIFLCFKLYMHTAVFFLSMCAGKTLKSKIFVYIHFCFSVNPDPLILPVHMNNKHVGLQKKQTHSKLDIYIYIIVLQKAPMGGCLMLHDSIEERSYVWLLNVSRYYCRKFLRVVA